MGGRDCYPIDNNDCICSSNFWALSVSYTFKIVAFHTTMSLDCNIDFLLFVYDDYIELYKIGVHTTESRKAQMFEHTS